MAMRLCTPADRSELTSFVNTIYEACEGHLWKPGRPRLTEHKFKERIYIMERAGKMIGSVEVYPGLGDDKLHFGMLCCHPDYRGQGVGTSIVKFVIELARREGFKGLRLDVLFALDDQGVFIHDKYRDFLEKWYTGFGFSFAESPDLEVYFADFDQLAGPSVVKCYDLLF